MASQAPKNVPTRAYHRKVKTGCLTCKIRRVRCDEGKPACNRCVSTGRKCDGYAPAPAAASTPSPAGQAASPSSGSSPASSSGSLVLRSKSPPRRIAPDNRLLLPQKNADELHVYSYFLKVAAPSIAGAFDSEFWLREVPQFCMADPAIWHAVTALGTVCRDYDFTSTQNDYALRQMTLAIQHLTEPKSSSAQDRWRALIASVLFTCFSVVQGKYMQAQMHVVAGSKIYKELEAEDQALQKRRGNNKSSLSPVSLASVRSVIIGFQIHEAAVDFGEVLGSPQTAIVPYDDSFAVWRTYSAPTRTGIFAHVLTPDNMMRAIRGSESLMFALILFGVAYFEEMKALTASGEFQLPSIAAKQRPHVRCYREIEKTINMFEEALLTGSPGEAGGGSIKAQFQKMLIYLRIMHLTTRMMLHKDPEEPNPIKRLAQNEKIGTLIVNLSEQVLDMEESGYGRGDGTYMMPSPPLTNPLGTVAQNGFGAATRRRAVDLLRRPRLEGLWDTLLSASLLEASLARETEARDAYWARKTAEEGVEMQPAVKGTGLEEIENGAHPQFRVYGAFFSFTSERTATLTLATWRDWIDGTSGGTTDIAW